MNKWMNEWIQCIINTNKSSNPHNGPSIYIFFGSLAHMTGPMGIAFYNMRSLNRGSHRGLEISTYFVGSTPRTSNNQSIIIALHYPVLERNKSIISAQNQFEVKYLNI